jgi:signal transduction histidine kinase
MAHVATQLGGVFERKRSADALRESEARLRQILESMPIGVFVMDAQGQPYFSNKYARSINRPEPSSRPDPSLQPPHAAGERLDQVYLAGTDQPYPPERHQLQRALAKESSVVADIEIRPHGRRIPLEVWGSPVFDERGRVAYALSAFYDISERKKVERMKDEFVSVVSHELRTPLTSMQGAIGLLENGVLGPLSEEALEMARIARDGCGRLLRLVNELLDVQKLDFGTPTLHPQPLPLAPILEAAVAASRPYAAALGIRLDLADGVPGAVVLADSDRLSQVVTNLLSNAIKYTPEGERVLVSATRATPSSSHVRVSVDDRGPGVPEEFQASLFQKFSQADASDARQKAGTGLGLAICKVIVEKLGGTIDYEPLPEGGARFYFELPELLRD